MPKTKINQKLKNFWSAVKAGFQIFYRKVIKDHNIQVAILVILVVLNTLFIQGLLTSGSKKGCFLNSSSKVRDGEVATSSAVTSGVMGKDSGLVSRLLDGILIENQASSSRVFALVIENHFEARPQAGLARANLVYEFLTEGGITRLLALYDASASVEAIGPVRSCREYFLDVSEEFQALFGHVGGSPGCLDSLKRRAYDVYDLNQYFKDEYFWRERNILPPHNVYTSSELLKRYLVDRETEEGFNFEPWVYKDEKLGEEYQSAQELTVDYSVNAYKVDWVYDQKKNDYLKYIADDLCKDKGGQEIRAKNIIVQYVKTWLLDGIGRLGMKLEGRGEVLVFLDGKVIEGYWKKESRGERTRFYTNDDIEVELNRGVTWVELVPTDRAVRYK